MKFKRLIMCILVLSILFLETQYVVVASDLPVRLFDERKAEEVIKKVIEAADRKEWSDFTNYMSDERQEYYNGYFSDEDMKDGIKQIREIELKEVYKVNRELAKGEWLSDEYPILRTCYEVYTFIVETECQVYEENQFFYNGINYFLVVIAVENESLKVVQFNKPSADLLSEIVLPELSKNDVEYDDKIAGIEVIKAAESGRVVNASQEELTEGFEVIHTKQEFGVTTFAADPPLLSHYATYHYPKKIKVLLNKTGATKTEVVEVDMIDYLKNVLPNEWIPSWEEQALFAGAYCVKMVAIYRAIKPMDIVSGYHLSQKTQNYVPGSRLYESTSEAIDAIYNNGMSDTYGILFFPRYEAGVSGQAGTEGSGHVKQYGTQYLARQGWSYQKILNYYYSGSDYSIGDVKFFSYNIGF